MKLAGREYKFKERVVMLDTKKAQAAFRALADSLGEWLNAPELQQEKLDSINEKWQVAAGLIFEEKTPNIAELDPLEITEVSKSFFGRYSQGEK